MKPPVGAAKILLALALFGYLTAEQVTRLLYAASSLAFVRKILKFLVDQGLVFTVGGRATNVPLMYTLSGKGRHYVSHWEHLRQSGSVPLKSGKSRRMPFSCGTP